MRATLCRLLGHRWGWLLDGNVRLRICSRCRRIERPPSAAISYFGGQS